MTLNWSQTAADCRVSEYLAPLVLQHFQLKKGHWSTVPTSGYPWKWERPTSSVTRLLFDLQEFLPAGKFWDRTRYRMGNTGSMNLVKANLVKYLMYREQGMSCTCGTVCRYPGESPAVPEPAECTREELEAAMNAIDDPYSDD